MACVQRGGEWLITAGGTRTSEKSEWEFESEREKIYGPSPEWALSGLGRNRPSPEWARENSGSLATRRTHLDPTKHTRPPQVFDRSDELACWVSLLLRQAPFFGLCCYRRVIKYEPAPFVISVLCRLSAASELGNSESCVIATWVAFFSTLKVWNIKGPRNSP